MLAYPGEPEAGAARAEGVRRARVRALSAVIALGAGYVAARHLPGADAAASAGAWFALACGALACAAATRGRACAACLVLAVAACGAGWFTLRVDAPKTGVLAPGADAASRAAGEAATGAARGTIILTAEGILVADPRPRVPAGALARFARVEAGATGEMSLRALVTDRGVVPASGRLLLRLPLECRGTLAAGDRVRATGVFRAVEPPRNPGEPDRRLWSAQEGIVGWLGVAAPGAVERLPDAGAAWDGAVSWMYARREGLRSGARALLGLDRPAGDQPGRALLAALFLGEREPGLDAVRTDFTRLGLAHALAISGFHLTVMAGVLMFLLRLTGDRGWAESAAVAGGVGAYLLVVPAEAPIWRAAIMVWALLAADACGRRYDRLTVLVWACAGLLVWRPLDLWSMGFQLSAGVTAALVWQGRALSGRLFGTPVLLVPRATRSLRRRARDAMGEFVSGNLLAWGVALPVIAYHTGHVALVGAAAGLVLLPALTVLLWVGYAALVLGALAPDAVGAAGAAGRTIEAMSAWIAAGAGALEACPGAGLTLPRVSAAWALAGVALALAWVRRGHAGHAGLWAATGAVLAWLAVEVALVPRLPRGVELRADALAVGDGTCLLLRRGSEAVLWDCGSSDPGVGRAVIPRAVRALGAGPVRTAVVTHPDFDHFSGLLDAAGPLGVRTLVVGRATLERAAAQPGGALARTIDGLRARGVAVRAVGAGDAIALGDAAVRLVSPPDPPPPRSQWPEDNDHSLVGLVEVGEGAGVRRLLLTGDIQARGIERVREALDGVRVDALELPHHGSALPAAVEFVAALDPGVVLQSTGERRAADPRWSAARAGRAWWTTATDGASWVEFRHDGAVASGSLRRRGGVERGR